jgi:hypothetical protein
MDDLVAASEANGRFVLILFESFGMIACCCNEKMSY